MCNLCNLKKYECTRKNDENCSKTERLAAVSVFVQSESPCLRILEIVWNYKTVKNAYFSKIQNSLKVSDFFPNCSRNNRISTSKNKGVDFWMLCTSRSSALHGVWWNSCIFGPLPHVARHISLNISPILNLKKPSCSEQDFALDFPENRDVKTSQWRHKTSNARTYDDANAFYVLSQPYHGRFGCF